MLQNLIRIRARTDPEAVHPVYTRRGEVLQNNARNSQR
jgi:hypothetical protein